MRYVKYCKVEHNVKSGSNTLQLGTFQYYRELDPSFTISDEHEGKICYDEMIDASSPLTLTQEQFNGIFGGAISIGFAGQNIQKIPGSVNIDISGGRIELVGMNVVYSGKIKVELTYPNAYMFCLSLLDEKESPNPQNVSKDYDSYYEFNESTIRQFVNFLTDLVLNQLTIADLDLTEEQQKISPNALTGNFQSFVHCSPITYIDKKEIGLKSANDFTENSILNRYQAEIFEKHIDYVKDKEFRLAVFIRHPMLGIVSVKKHPKLLSLNPILDFVV